MKREEKQIVQAVIEDVLTSEERQHVEQLCLRGPSYFTDIGWNAEKAERFMARPAVRRQIDNNSAVFEEADAFSDRMAFYKRVQMSKMLPQALSVLRRRLQGLTPLADGTMLRAADIPTDDQFEAAQVILNEFGVDPKTGLNVTIATSSSQVTAPADKHDLASVMSRDRVRVAVLKIVNTFGKSDESQQSLKEERIATKKARKLRREKRRNREEEDR